MATPPEKSEFRRSSRGACMLGGRRGNGVVRTGDKKWGRVEFKFGYVELEMTVGPPCGDVRWVAGFTVLGSEEGSR